MNQANWDITRARSLTPRILPAITLDMPIGVSHMTPVTIFMTTSKTAVKNCITTCPFSPIVPKRVPKTRQKKTIPRVLVPERYCTTRTSWMFSFSSKSPVCVVFRLVSLMLKGLVFRSYTVWACWNAAWKRLSGKIFLE